jgi:hypothetical protein
LPAVTPESATDFLGLKAGAAVSIALTGAARLTVFFVVTICHFLNQLFGFALGKQHIELAFEFMIVDALVELFTCLHQIDDVALVTIATDCGVDRFSGFVHSAENGKRVEHHADTGAA